MSNRALRALTLGGVAIFGSFPIAAAAATDSPVVTVGSNNPNNAGFNSGLFGSISPTATANGHTYMQLYSATGRPGMSFFSAKDFTSDPGKSWLTSVSCAGNTATVSSTTSYFFSGGQASWAFSNQNLLFGQTIGSNVTCTVVHS
jgi:hypothetical protein